MLNTPHSSSQFFVDGIVTAVDPIRFICSVKTSSGKMLSEVSWLLPTGGISETGMHITPNVQDKVLVSTSLGYPLILGCIPRMGNFNGEIQQMTGSGNTIDLGYNSSLGSLTNNPSKPSDFCPGDLVYTSKGGGMLAVLLGGISILKASTLSQIVLCKYEGLVRVVTRNYQRFSDASSRVSVNMKGRLYEYFTVDTDILRNQSGQERYHEAFGDIPAAEVLKASPSSSIVLPSVDTRIRKKWLQDASGKVLYAETLNQDGSITTLVKNAAGDITSTTNITNILWSQTLISGGKTANITISPSDITINYNGTTGKFSDTGIDLNTVADINITGTNITLTGNVIMP